MSACSAIDTEKTSTSNRQVDNVMELNYFPLAVGNSWRYSCAVEGEHAFDKTISITAGKQIKGIHYFRAELQVDNAPSLLEMFYFQDEKGGVYSTVDRESDENVLLITANPKIGDAIGALTVSSEQEVVTPATDNIKALLVESYSLEQPTLSDEQRMEWEGKYYARDVGLVIEADGLGGECVLVEFSLVK
jgi:hypothetical protein